MRLDLETEVRYPEGERVGIIKRVVLGEDNEVEAIVLATDEFVSRNLVVPLHLLSEEPGGVVTLNATPEDLDALEHYEEGLMPDIPGGWEQRHGPALGGDVFPDLYQPILPVVEMENLRSDLMGISQGTEIQCLDGPWGIVDEVLVSDDGQAYALIGRPYAKDDFDRIIPLDLVSEVRPDLALLNCTIADLPTYTQETVNEQEEPEAQ